jgi:hypothetical protein
VTFVFGWLAPWLGCLILRGEHVPYTIVSHETGTRKLARLPCLQGLVPYEFVPHWQLIALARQFERLRLTVEHLGPSLETVKGLVLVFQQAKDGVAGRC